MDDKLQYDYEEFSDTDFHFDENGNYKKLRDYYEKVDDIDSFIESRNGKAQKKLGDSNTNSNNQIMNMAENNSYNNMNLLSTYPDTNYQIEKDDDYFLIESKFELNKYLDYQSNKIKIVGDSDLVKYVLKEIDAKDIKSITHLKIETDKLSSNQQQSIIKIIKANLEVLNLFANEIEHQGIFVKHLHFYSKLKYLNIKINKNTSSNFEYDSSLNQDYDLSTRCNLIIEKNREIDQFIKSIPSIIENLYELELINEVNINNENTVDLTSNDFTYAKVAYLYEIGELFYTYLDYERFKPDLFSNKISKLIFKLSEQYNIQQLISFNNVEVLKQYFNKLSIDINTKYYQLNNKESYSRLIDLAVNHKNEVITKFLLDNGAEPICCNSDVNKSKIYLAKDLNNFPLYSAFYSQNQILSELFINNEIALYDGLAWAIRSGEISFYKDLVKKTYIKINLLKSITQGNFKGFNLLNLSIFYQNTELTLELIKKLEENDIETLFDISFPEREDFEYSNWSVFSYLIYKGMHDELKAILPSSLNKNKFKINNSLDSNPIKLISYGATRISIYNQENKKQVENFKRSFDLLMDFEFSSLALDAIDIYDKNMGTIIPLLYFCIQNQIFFLIADKLSMFQNKLLAKVRIDKYDLNYIQFAAIKEYRDAIHPLFNLYKENKLLDIIIEDTIPELYISNLFQLSLLSIHNFSLFKLLLSYNNCPINDTFPKDHPSYPGWLPINVILIRSFIDGYQLLIENALSLRQDWDITKKFVGEGDPHWLSELYITSAIFFNSNPFKDNELSPRNLSNYIDDLLPLIHTVTCSDTKQEILDQALLVATIYHDKKSRLDYTKHLNILLQNGADAYRDFGDERQTILDIAEEKGLHKIFQKYINEYKRTLISKAIKLNPSIRKSELDSTRLISNQISIVSLVRNINSTVDEHVFIVIERLINGRSHIHFIDFVHNPADVGNGKVRFKSYEGKLKEQLLFKCDLKLMDIKEKAGLAFQSWDATNDACENLIRNCDPKNEINKGIGYLAVGNRSIIGKALSKKGHSCYTWACEKLSSTESTVIEQDLAPTFGDWFFSLPSRNRFLKHKTEKWYNNRYALFAGKTLVYSAAAVGVLYSTYSIYNYYTSSKNNP